jgi:hypothetical protein
LPNLDDNRKELRKNLAERVRFLAVGVLAAFWALSVGGPGRQPLLGAIGNEEIVYSAILAVLALVFDFLQELFDYGDNAMWLAKYTRYPMVHRVGRAFGPLKKLMFGLKIIAVICSSMAFLVSMSMLLSRRVMASGLDPPWRSFWTQTSGESTSPPFLDSGFLYIGLPRSLDGSLDGCYADANGNCIESCTGAEELSPEHQMDQEGYFLTLKCGSDDLAGDVLWEDTQSWNPHWEYRGEVSSQVGLKTTFLFLLSRYDPRW